MYLVDQIAELTARQFLLLASIGFLFLVLWGRFRDFGLPNLFWGTSVESEGHASGDRLLIGFSIGVLLGAEAFLAVLVASAGADWTPEVFVRWFHRLSLTAFVAVLLSWLVAPAGTMRTRKPREAGAYLLPLGASAGFAVVIAIVWWAPAVTPGWLRDFVSWTLPRDEPLGLLRFHTTAGLMLVMGTSCFVGLRALNLYFQRELTPAGAICILLAMVGAVHGFVAFRSPAGQLPVYVLLLFACAFLSAWFQRARVPVLECCRSHRGAADLLRERDVLVAWKKRHASKPVLVVVAADGGGIRSALWTMNVLTRLEEEFPDFALHTRLITGASGGMVGAAMWTATLRESSESRGPRHQRNGRELPRKELLDTAAHGGLGAIASRLVLRDVLPPPLRIGHDRGRALEMVWEKYWPELAEPLSHLSAGERGGWRPSLVLAPMIAEDGRRLVVSNLDLHNLLCHHGPFASKHALYSMGGVQLFEKLPGAQGLLRLSTAARLQANFPWVLPATELPELEPGKPRLRVVDAGYYDETGADLAAQWIFSHREWLKENTSGVLLLQNRDTPSIPRRSLPAEKRRFWNRGLDGISTPISAWLRAADSTTWYHADALVAALARVFNEREPAFFTTVAFELNRKASLSWSITRAEAADIENDIDNEENQASLESLKRWWRSREASVRAASVTSRAAR